jgi:chorismate synthase
MAALVLMDQVLIQNARRTAASLLAPLQHLPPSMVMPPKKVVQKLVEYPEVEEVKLTSA